MQDGSLVAAESEARDYLETALEAYDNDWQALVLDTSPGSDSERLAQTVILVSFASGLLQEWLGPEPSMHRYAHLPRPTRTLSILPFLLD